MGIVPAVVCVGLTCFQSIIHVYDGDTFTIGRDRFRVAGIDALEIRGDCRNEKILAKEAKVTLEGLLRNTRVDITPEGTDRYGRVLAVVHANGTDVSEVLIEQGLSRRWTKKWNRQPEPWCLK